MKNNWEKCPLCNGTGLVQANTNSSSATAVCPVCKGEKIINSITGKPPVATAPNFEQKRSWSRSMARKILNV
jgi:hypothetical protein